MFSTCFQDGIIGLDKGAVGGELAARKKIVQTPNNKEHPEIDLPEAACDTLFEQKVKNRVPSANSCFLSCKGWRASVDSECMHISERFLYWGLLMAGFLPGQTGIKLRADFIDVEQSSNPFATFLR